jgi:hypothetical protein
MAAEDYTIIDLSSTINTKKRSCIVISSDDEGRPVADDDDLIILDSKRPKNTALDVEIIDESCTFNDKHDFRYHFNLESLMTTAKEFYDHSNKINSSQNNHTDHLLALQLQAEDDVIFCTRTIDPTRSEVRITKITTPEPKNDTTIPSSTSQAPQINVELPNTVSRPTIPRNTTCTCTTATTTTTGTSCTWPVPNADGFVYSLDELCGREYDVTLPNPVNARVKFNLWVENTVHCNGVKSSSCIIVPGIKPTSAGIIIILYLPHNVPTFW